MEELFKDFEFEENIDVTTECVNDIKLPKDYLEFMRKHSGGGEGNIGNNSYGCLYSLAELKEINDMYEIKQYLPNTFIGGSDRGGMFFGYNNKTKKYYEIDDCFMSEEDTFHTADTLAEFFLQMDKED